MKRTPKKHYCVRRTYPWLFWRRCVKCGQEFRHEWGWKYQLGNLYYRYTRYICSACAPDIDAAEDLRHRKPVSKPPETGTGVQNAQK